MDVIEIGANVAHKLMIMYPENFKGVNEIRKGEGGVLLPTGCVLIKNRRGRWAVKSYHYNNMDYFNMMDDIKK